MPSMGIVIVNSERERVSAPAARALRGLELGPRPRNVRKRTMETEELEILNEIKYYTERARKSHQKAVEARREAEKYERLANQAQKNLQQLRKNRTGGD